MKPQFSKIRRNAVAAASMVAVGALALAGCSGTGGSPAASNDVAIPSTDPTATVKVLSYLSQDGVQPVLDAFMKAHPTIKVEWQSVPFDSLSSTIDANVANKQGSPDVYWADQPRISALAARGEAQDLTSAFSQYKDKFDASPYESGLYNGKLYALPLANSTQLLYYNKDLLDKAGIAHPSASVDGRMTWEQLATDAAKAKAAGSDYGMMFGQFDRYYQLETLPVSLGGSVGASGDRNLTPDFTSDAWVKSLDWYGSLFKNGTAPRGVTPDQTDGAFLAGKSAYFVEGPWLVPELASSKINWGVAAQPTFKDAKPVTADGSWSAAMNPYSKSKEAAAVLMKWLTVDNGAGYIKYGTATELAANIEGKKIYFDKPAFSSPEGKNAATIIQSETSTTAVNRVSTVGYIEFETVLNQAFSDIRNGAQAKTALDKAAADLTTQWAKYK